MFVESSGGLSPVFPSVLVREVSPEKKGEESAHSMSGAAAFVLHRRVGMGGSAEIWDATQRSLDRHIAIKRLRHDLHKTLAGTPQGLQVARAFRQEALLTANLQHPNIVPVHDLGVDDQGRPLLVMKLVRGVPWPERIEEDANLPAWEFWTRHLSILIDVAQAVAFAHAHGVIHRDIKPSQVMIGDFGEVMLMDWGLALFLEKRCRPDTQIPRRVLQGLLDTAMNPAGTPSYMAPEQTSEDLSALGPWTDTFMLGGILYYLLTRMPPHSSLVAGEAALAEARKPVEPPNVRAPKADIPPELADIAMKALAPDPKDRFQDAEEFIAAVRDYLSGVSHRRESQQIVEQVQKEFAQSPDQYKTLTEGLVSLARAEGLWPGNPGIAGLRLQIRDSFVNRALAEGDLHLARLEASRLEQETLRTKRLREVEAAQRRVERAAIERRIALAAVAVAIVLLLFGSYRYVSGQKKARHRAEAAERDARLSQSRAEAAAVEAQRQRERAEEARLQAEAKQYVAAINAAALNFRDGGTLLTEKMLLQQTPAWARHWEWGFLMNQLHLDQMILCKAPIGAEAYDACFSPDGRRIASGDRKGTAYLWDAETGKLLNSEKIHSKGIWSIVFSPDGKKILTASLDYTAAILDAETLKPLCTLKEHKNLLRGAAFSRDGRYAATASRDKTARVWDAATGQLLNSFAFKDSPYDVDFSPDGRILAVAGLGRIANLVDWTESRTLQTFQGFTGNVRSIRFDREGKRVLTASGSNEVQVFEAATGKVLLKLPLKECTPNCAVFSPDDRMIATSDFLGNGHLWDAASGDLLATLYATPGGWHIAFSPDGKRIATACDNQVRVWRVEDVIPQASRIAQADLPPQATPETFRILSFPSERTDIWYDLDNPWIQNNGVSLFQKNGRFYRANSYYSDFHPDGRTWIELDYKKLSVVLHTEGSEPVTVPTAKKYLNIVRFSPSGRYFATGEINGQVEVWETSPLRRVGIHFEKDEMVGSLCFNPDETRLAYGGALGYVRIWDFHTTRALEMLDGHKKQVPSLMFSRDGKRLLSGSSDRTGKVWNAETGELYFTLAGDQNLITAAVFSPDEKRILTASYDGIARLWDARTGESLMAIYTSQRNRSLLGGGFSRDGQQILLAVSNGDLVVLDAMPWRDEAYPQAPGEDFARRMELWKRRYRLNPGAQWSDISWNPAQ